MNIPKNMTAEWRKYLDHGDMEEIAKEAGVSTKTISKAFNSHIATIKTIQAIKKFVDRKKELLKA